MNIKWNEYTWYSKLGAIILFILVLPMLTFYIGTQYEKTVEVLNAVDTYRTPPVVKSSGQTPPPIHQPTKQTPYIMTLTPSTGPAGTIVTITGSGFDRNENSILFGKSNGNQHLDGSADNVIARASSTDGTTLTFNVPTTGPSGIICSQPGHCIGISAMLLSPGAYPVSVTNVKGASNVLSFTLTR